MKSREIFEFKNLEGIRYKVFYKKPKYWVIRNGKKEYVNVYATCDSPENKNPKIEIQRNIKNNKELEVVIEEFLHAFFYEKKEKEIRPAAKCLSKFLAKTGWSKTIVK